MPRLTRALIGLPALVAIALAQAPAAEEVKVRADRTALTFRDCGLYCNYGMWHGIDPATEDASNMLPASRVASTASPWTFYIMQYYAPHEPRKGFHGGLIREMAGNGKKVILRADIGRMHKDVDVDKMEQRLSNMLQEVDPDWLYAITLDEEQVFWNGWSEALAELYHRCKKRWPELPVYQWWTPMEVPNVRAKTGWVALPADGWVIDLYGQPREAFEKKVVKALETGKPLVHIAWASPDWPDYCGAESWNDGGREIFDNQLEVCRGYNVPVAYFCTQKDVVKDGKQVAPIRWGWHAEDETVRDWYRALEAMVMNLRHLPADQIGFRALDARKFDWAHGSRPPVELTYSLDDEGRKRFAWRSYLSDAPTEPGEHALEAPLDNPYIRVTLILDETAAGLDQGLALRGVEGRPSRAALVFRVEPRRPLADLAVTAGIYAEKALGGFAKVSVSANGQSWSEATKNDPEERQQGLTVRGPAEGWSDAPVWVRVVLESLSGKETNVCASLNWLEVSGAFEPALGRSD